MGFLDDSRVSPLASDVFRSISDAEKSTGVHLSSAAREIVALFTIAPTFEDPEVTYDSAELNTAGAQVTGLLREQMPDLLQEIRDAYGILQRQNYRGLVTTADLYHFLTKGSLDDILAAAGLEWPYPKD
jgi:hypothetical protein